MVARACELRIVAWYVQNESHAVFLTIENERNAFSRLMGMELPLTNCFKLFVPSLPWQIDRLSMP